MVIIQGCHLDTINRVSILPTCSTDLDMPFYNNSATLRLYYNDPAPEGSPCVILLHGLGATNESWAFQVPALVTHRYRVLVPDIRGFGRSTYPGKAHSIQDLAGDIIHIMDHEAITSAHLVGISMGGAIALQLACDYSNRFEKLVLVNTFARLRPNSFESRVYFLIRFGLVHVLGLQAQAHFVANRLFPGPDQDLLRETFVEQIMHSDPRGYRATMRALSRLNLTQRLPGIPHQTLVITGEHDFTVPPHIQTQLKDEIPNAYQVLIPGAGHAVSVEKPAEFNKILVEFLSDETGTTCTN